MHDDDLQRVIDRAEDLLRAIEEDADDSTRRVVFELLQHVDTIHREGLSRLRAMLRTAGHASILEKSSDDFAVRVLLELYDMLPLPAGAASPSPRTGSPGRAGFVPLDAIGVGRPETTNRESSSGDAAAPASGASGGAAPGDRTTPPTATGDDRAED